MWQGFDMYGLIYCMLVCVVYRRIRIRKATYTTVSTVSSAALLWCLVDLDVLNDQVSGIETLGIGVCLCVLQETEEELGGLDWPSSTGYTELLS